MYFRVIVLLASIAISLSFPVAAAEITGKPRVVDGDTIELSGRTLDLFGIDAPEPDQTCTENGRPWRCGLEATFALAYELAEHWVRCQPRGAGNPAAAVCYIGPYDLAERMVRRGWAVADRDGVPAYLDAENAARSAGAGLWRGAFVAPSEWRDRRRGGPD